MPSLRALKLEGQFLIVLAAACASCSIPRMKILRQVRISFSCALALLFGCAAQRPVAGARASQEFLVYFGTYTGATSKGIYVSRLNLATGKLSAPELAAEIASPSFLAIHPNHGFLYAVNEVGNFAGKRSGAVTAFAIDGLGFFSLEPSAVARLFFNASIRSRTFSPRGRGL